VVSALTHCREKFLDSGSARTWSSCLIGAAGTVPCRTIATDYSAVAGGVGGVISNRVRRWVNIGASIVTVSSFQFIEGPIGGERRGSESR
jgi:hypothetical protein